MHIADRPLSLADHFRAVVTSLRNGECSYNWNRHVHCNCGLVARSIIPGFCYENVRPLVKEIFLINGSGPTWTEMAKRVCPVTGEPMDVIFSRLWRAGLQREDFEHLENLSNPEILTKMNVSRPIRESEFDFIRYLYAWASLIEQFHEKRLEEVEMRELVESRELVEA